MKKTKVVFAVIAYNQQELVDSCLLKLRSFLPAGSQVILFDNHSINSLEPLAKKHSVEFVRSKKNKGFAGGCNEAIDFVLAHFETEWIALVNSDLFIDKAFGESLHKVLQSASNLAA